MLPTGVGQPLARGLLGAVTPTLYCSSLTASESLGFKTGSSPTGAALFPVTSLPRGPSSSQRGQAALPRRVSQHPHCAPGLETLETAGWEGAAWQGFRGAHWGPCSENHSKGNGQAVEAGDVGILPADASL